MLGLLMLMLLLSNTFQLLLGIGHSFVGGRSQRLIVTILWDFLSVLLRVDRLSTLRY